MILCLILYKVFLLVIVDFMIFFWFINLTMTVKDHQNCVPLKKERFWSVLFRAPLFLSKWCGVTTYFFMQRIRKTKYMIELFSSLIGKKSLHN